MTQYLNPSTRLSGAKQILVGERASTAGLVQEPPVDGGQYTWRDGEWVDVAPEIAELNVTLGQVQTDLADVNIELGEAQVILDGIDDKVAQAKAEAIEAAELDAQEKADLAEAAAIAQAVADAAAAYDGTKSLVQTWTATDQVHIDGGALQADSVTTLQLAADSVEANNIKAGAVVAGKLAADSVLAANIKAGEIGAAHVAANQISAVHIVGESITADELAANSVTTAKINALAVNADKLAANAVTADKIAANAVAADKIAANAVTAAKIAADAIDGKTITGATLQTSATGERIVIEGGTDATDNEIRFYAPTGTDFGVLRSRDYGAYGLADVVSLASKAEDIVDAAMDNKRARGEVLVTPGYTSLITAVADTDGDLDAATGVFAGTVWAAAAGSGMNAYAADGDLAAGISVQGGPDASSGSIFLNSPYIVVSTRITITGGVWQTPTLTDGWVNYGANFAPAAYRLRPDGFVHLRGTVKSGSSGSGTAVFTLPVGRRPADHLMFSVPAGAAGAARIFVLSNGVVRVESYYSGGTNTLVALDGISFDVTT